MPGHPAPLVELGHALASLRRGEPSWTGWRRRAASRLPAPARALLDLIPPTATGPLFLDPITTSLGAGLEAVQRSSAAFVLAELSRVPASGRPPGWVRLLPERDRRTWRDLDRALRLAYGCLLAEDWHRVWSGFRADIACRSRLIAEQGVQAALSSLHPTASWDGPVLRIAAAPELDFHPSGAGLTLLPSPLWPGRPLVGEHPDGSTVIVYPALTPLPLIDDAAADPLARLLGHSRAAVLRLASTEHTTSELARELGVSAAAISAHTRALRDAGLIVTVRAGRAVLHSTTPLGGRLLEDSGRER